MRPSNTYPRYYAVNDRPVKIVKACRPVERERVAPNLPFVTRVGERALTIRLSDFPAEPLYTLLAEGDEIADRTMVSGLEKAGHTSSIDRQARS
jgi:hypothetical protein